MNRTDIINFYTAKFPECSYLEVGVGNLSANFSKINATSKICVDPRTKDATYVTTSDDFFAANKNKYDVIFIDGDHRAVQVIKDINNALKSISPNGIILLHDCNPLLEVHQREDIVVSHWNGSVWKAILFYRMTEPNISIQTIDTDEGIGIIKPFGKQQLFTLDGEISFEHDAFSKYFDFNFLSLHRQSILNLLTTDEWIAAEAQNA